MVYEEILKEAQQAADKAANEKFENMKKAGPKFSVHNSDLMDTKIGPPIGYLLDNCGGAYLLLDGRDPLVRHFKKVGRKHGCWYQWGNCSITKGAYKGYQLSIQYPLRRRQEMGIHEVANEAAAKVLKSHGINVYVKTYID